MEKQFPIGRTQLIISNPFQVSWICLVRRKLYYMIHILVNSKKLIHEIGGFVKFNDCLRNNSKYISMNPVSYLEIIM